MKMALKKIYRVYMIYMGVLFGEYFARLCSLLLCRFGLMESGDVWFFRIVEANVFITLLTIFNPIPFVLGAVCLAFSITHKDKKKIPRIATLSVLYIFVLFANIAMIVSISGF